MKNISTDNENTPNASVGTRIVEIRGKLGKNQTQFAKFLGITQGRLSQIENGSDMPTSDLVKIIVENCGVSYDWLMSGISEANKNTLTDSQEGYNLPDCNTVKAINELLKKQLEGKDTEIEYLKKCLDAKGKELEYALKSVAMAENQSLVLAGVIDRLTQK